MVFQCTASNCKFKGDKSFMVHIPLEVYEKNNTATLFCPHCGSPLEEICDVCERKKMSRSPTRCEAMKKHSSVMA